MLIKGRLTIYFLRLRRTKRHTDLNLWSNINYVKWNRVNANN